MSLSVVSLLALLVAIAIGYARKLNTGVLAIGFAFILGQFLFPAYGQPPMPSKDIVSGWPLKLFFVLLGMTFLFSIASVNGTLPLIARKITGLTGGRRKLTPVVFFLMAGVLAAIGPGNIATCALLLPIALAVAEAEGIPALLLASMVIAGSNAGGLSPIAPTGIIGVTLAREAGLEVGWSIFSRQVIGQGIFVSLLYVLLGGYRLSRSDRAGERPPPFNAKQWLTLAVILAVVSGIVIGKWHIGLCAFLGASMLVLCKAADENRAIQAIPWPTLILVCGVGMLVNVLQVAGGIDCLTRLLAGFMNRDTAAPIMACTGGLMSIVSSASGVVMPTLIPTAPKLVASVGGQTVSVISAIIMGAHMVANSPLSTLGALAMTAAGEGIDRDGLFRGLLLLAIAGLFYAALIVFIGIV